MKTFVGGITLFLLALTVPAQTLVLQGATLFASPTATPINSANLMVEDGVISSIGQSDIPQGAKLIDLTGKFLMAGFWNSHVHHLLQANVTFPENRSKLQAYLCDYYLKWGFVNTIDMGSDPAILSPIDEAIESGRVNGPKIYKMGGSFVAEGGSPFYIAPVQLPEFKSASQAGEMTKRVLASGVDGIKLFTASWDTPSTLVLMNPDHAKAAVAVAHQQGKLVFAHPSDSAGARIAIESGVDVLAHAFPAELKGPWDRSLPAQMKRAGMSLIPTLKVFRYDLQRIGLPSDLIDRLEQNAIDQLAAVYAAGSQILFGTDVGYMEDPDTIREFQLMARAGLDFAAILESLTTGPAKLLKVSHHQGILKEGYQADLVVLNTDPRLNVAAFADVNAVIKKGQVIYQKKGQ